MNNQLWYLFIEETYANKDLNKHVSSFKLETLNEILNYNLSMPLRCLNVNLPLIITINSITKDDIKNMLFNLQLNLFKNTFSDFKFKSLNKQLSNLTVFNRHMWKYQYKQLHDKYTLSTEGDSNYLMYFWATKIGSQKHAFDCNPEGLFPLLCNARNKIILLFNKETNDFVARAYIRILQTETSAILLLEDIIYNINIHDDDKMKDVWKQYIINHAYSRAQMLKLKLVIPWIDSLPKEKFNIILDKSDGFYENSKYLNYYDEIWVQNNTEYYELFHHVYKANKNVS